MDPRKILQTTLNSMLRILRASEALQSFHVDNSGWSQSDLSDGSMRLYLGDCLDVLPEHAGTRA